MFRLLTALCYKKIKQLKKIIYFLSTLIFCSCMQEAKNYTQKEIQTILTNKDHVVMLDDKIVYAIYKNLTTYELYAFDKDSYLIKSKTMHFITDHKKNRIKTGMTKDDVINILGEPALKEPALKEPALKEPILTGESIFVYFQKYIDFNLFNLSCGTDRRIFIVTFTNNKVTSYKEEYVSRA